MTAIKAEDVARRMTGPDKVPPLVLVYGADRGHVSEIADLVARAALGASEDPFALVALAADEIASDPARLVDEARTISMFGGRRLVRVKDAGTRNLMPALEPLVDEPPTDAVILVEAGDLKKTAPIRKRLETHRRAATIACYPDMAAQLDRLIDTEADALGLAVERDARDLLHHLLGGDRIASRGELTKLCLYAHGDGAITVEHVREIVGDVSGLATGDAIDAAFLGRSEALEAELRKLWTAGTHPSVVASSAVRWSQSLLAASVDVARGQEPRAAVERMTPRIHFQRKADVAGMLEVWRPERLEQVARRLDAAVLSTRRQPQLARETVGAALHEVAIRARSGNRRR